MNYPQKVEDFDYLKIVNLNQSPINCEILAERLKCLVNGNNEEEQMLERGMHPSAVQSVMPNDIGGLESDLMNYRAPLGT